MHLCKAKPWACAWCSHEHVRGIATSKRVGYLPRGYTIGKHAPPTPRPMKFVTWISEVVPQPPTALVCKCNANFAKYPQNFALCWGTVGSVLHCIFSTVCGALGPGRYVLVKRNYMQCGGIMQTDGRVHSFSYMGACIVSWPWACALGKAMIVITVQPITWPTHPPSRPSTDAVPCKCNSMRCN